MSGSFCSLREGVPLPPRWAYCLRVIECFRGVPESLRERIMCLGRSCTVLPWIVVPQNLGWILGLRRKRAVFGVIESDSTNWPWQKRTSSLYEEGWPQVMIIQYQGIFPAKSSWNAALATFSWLFFHLWRQNAYGRKKPCHEVTWYTSNLLAWWSHENVLMWVYIYIRHTWEKVLLLPPLWVVFFLCVRWCLDGTRTESFNNKSLAVDWQWHGI